MSEDFTADQDSLLGEIVFDTESNEFGEIVGVEYEGTYLNEPTGIWSLTVQTRRESITGKPARFRKATADECSRFRGQDSK